MSDVKRMQENVNNVLKHLTSPHRECQECSARQPDTIFLLTHFLRYDVGI